MAKKGQKFKHWTTEEKYKVIEPALNLEKSSHEVARENNLIYLLRHIITLFKYILYKKKNFSVKL